jgi:hypothetical protein
MLEPVDAREHAMPTNDDAAVPWSSGQHVINLGGRRLLPYLTVGAPRRSPRAAVGAFLRPYFWIALAAAVCNADGIPGWRFKQA